MKMDYPCPMMTRLLNCSMPNLVVSALLVGIGLLIGLFQVQESGAQWIEDGPRYANNGAMMQDWILSRNFLKPVEFAKENYAQYPAHSVPYHPPGYAFMLGVWFLITGMSYESARALVALFLSGTGLGFYFLVRSQGGSLTAAMFAALLLMTSPELARWGRCTMSEIPSLFFIVISNLCYWQWYKTSKNKFIWIAFGFAGLAFSCRVTAAGIVPLWFLMLAVERSWKRIFSVAMLTPSLLYLSICYAWTKFVGNFAKYEIDKTLFEELQQAVNLDNITVWGLGLPGMIGWVPLIAALIALLPMVIEWGQRARMFYVLWFVSYYVFQVGLNTGYETRYFAFSLPAVFGLVAIAFDRVRVMNNLKYAAPVLAIIVLGVNLIGAYQMPRGFVGYDRVAKVLQEQDDPGNVLLSCWADSDFIFRYRCSATQNRQMIRGDRTLAIRLSDYANVDSIQLAKNAEDVLNVLIDGRCRYLLTSSSSVATHDNRPQDMVLASMVAVENPDKFTLVEEFRLEFDFYAPREATVRLYRFEEMLPDGKSELPIVIPTADLLFSS